MRPHRLVAGDDRRKGFRVFEVVRQEALLELGQLGGQLAQLQGFFDPAHQLAGVHRLDQVIEGAVFMQQTTVWMSSSAVMRMTGVPG